MRWKANKPGDTKTITRFLLFPVCIRKEWRWLEKATIIQIYNSVEDWENDWWADDELLDLLSDFTTKTDMEKSFTHDRPEPTTESPDVRIKEDFPKAVKTSKIAKE